MKRILLAVAVLALPVMSLAQTTHPSPTTATTQAAENHNEFLRFVSDPKTGSQLQAAEVTYRNAAGVTLRLVSAVHIGERAYYHTLAKNFAGDDAVLYEMIKEKGQPIPAPGENGDHAVTGLQQFLRDKLNLAYQLDEIDYRKANFVHADLDLRTFQRLQAARGESMATLLMNSMTQALARGDSGAGGDSASQLIFLIASPDPERQMKLALAQQMQDIEAVAMGLDGPNGSVILSGRNKAAIAVLEEQLKLGKKKLSIFYGAAHMPDLARRVQEMGFTPVSTEWHTAWDVTIRPGQPSMLQKWFGASPTTEP